MQASVSTDQGTTTFRSRTPPSTQRSRLGSDRTLPPPPENAPLRDMYVRYWFLKTWLPAERKAYKWEGEVPWSGWGSQRILDSHPGLGNAKGVMSSKSKEFTSLCLSFLLCKVRIIFLSSVQSLSCVRFFLTPWTAACQASLSITNSQSLLKLMSIESMMPSNYLILCCPLLLPPSAIPSIKVFSTESVLCIRWPKYWSFSFNITPSKEYLELISFRMDWLDLLAVQGTLKSLLQHHSSKASVLPLSAFFTQACAVGYDWHDLAYIHTCSVAAVNHICDALPQSGGRCQLLILPHTSILPD